MTDVGAWADGARLAAAGLLVAAGTLFVVSGAIGVLRFPDLYARVHGATAADGVGAALFAAGLALTAPDWRSALGILFLGALLAGLAPVNAHLVANAAHAAGLVPLTGPLRASGRKDERS